MPPPAGAAGDPAPSGPTGVVHIITWLDAGGAQHNTLLSCRGLAERSVQVLLVAGTRRGEPGPLLSEARAAGLDVVVIDQLRQEVSWLNELTALVRLTLLLRRRRPAVVHTHSSKAGALGRLAARLARVPVVVHTVHGWSFHDAMRGASRRAVVLAERLAARWTDVLVVLSEADREKGLRHRIGRRHQYALVRSGVDVERFGRDLAQRRAAARRAFGLAEDSVVVGTVARLSEQKDPLTLVGAAHQLASEVPALKLVVVGDGPLRADVERACRERGLEEVVQLLGARGDVEDILPAFDVFVLSSRWEGLPRVVVEAMAAKVPVIATDIEGTREIVVDNETGLLVPPCDPAAVAGAVTRLLGDPVLADRLTSAGAECVQEWDWNLMIDRLLHLYRRALPADATARLVGDEHQSPPSTDR